MAKSLVIVESPAKAKTINKYLGSDFSVKASLGHIKDLPKKGLGVDLKNDFEPSYQIIPGKEKVIKELRVGGQKRGVRSSSRPTRTGKEKQSVTMCLRSFGMKKRKIYRVMFNEITQKAVSEAFHNPGSH